MRRLLVVALAGLLSSAACAYPDYSFEEADGSFDDASSDGFEGGGGETSKDSHVDTIVVPIDGGCPAGLVLCGAVCADLTTDPSHCGSCSQSCGGGTTCISGKCACPSTRMTCSGTCIHVQHHARHCGSRTT